MPSLMEILPLLKGWEDEFDYVLNKVVQPGKKFIVPLKGRWKVPGWFRNALLVSNNPYVILESNIWQKPFSVTPYFLNLWGVAMGPSGLTWVTKYDAVNNIYTILFEPQPTEKFQPGTWFIMIAPDKNPLTGVPITTPTVMTVFWHVVKIMDEKKFRRSLKEVLGTEKIPRILR